MKLKIVAFCFLPLLAFSWTEDYGQEGFDVSIEEILFNFSTQKLYEELFPLDVRRKFPAQTAKSFWAHTKDSYARYPEPNLIAKKNLKLVRKIQGTMTYVGFFKKKYLYDVLQSPEGEIVMNVRVHLQNATAQDFTEFSQKMKLAEEIWNISRVPVDFQYRFQFEIVKSPSRAHFSVAVENNTRGPYDQFWGRNWSARVVAHEVGHMLGLGDEYQTLSGNMDCYLESLMCSAWSGDPLLHQYYFILRRLITKPL